MSWTSHHSESERLASQAEVELLHEHLERAIQLYKLAAAEEILALQDADKDKTRTLGITAVSAASLFFKANEFRRAQSIAHEWLASELLPAFAIDQLQVLLQTIWSEEIRHRSGIRFTKGEVLVAVSGGEIIRGGAPLELILRKVNEVSKLFYRTVEMLLDLPLRRHGEPNLEIQQQCRPWLFQAAPSSYQFAVRVEQPQQLSLPTIRDNLPKVEQVTQKFLEIVQASAEDPEGKLVEIVPNAQYRATFLKLTRNLAPTSKSSFGRVELKAAGRVSARPVILRPTEREAINEAIRAEKAASQSLAESASETELQLRGVLRGLQLDDDWIDIDLPGEARPTRIIEVNEAIDDVIGPMVNQQVVVDVVKKPNGKYAFRDIQSEE
jgi:hypothetical protein